MSLSLQFTLETDRYHFFETVTDIFKKHIHRYLASYRYSIGHRYRYFNICLPIFSPIFYRNILLKVGVDCLQPRRTAAY